MTQQLDWYLEQTRSFPLLEADEERQLVHDWQDSEDPDAARQLLGSHLRLVVKIARGFGGYGMPMADLVAEGNVGLAQALARFDPDREIRFATYAMWWVRAAIREHVLHNRSLVKLGTTAAQKKLFFNLRRIKGRMQELRDGDLSPEAADSIAEELAVSAHEVVDMDRRLSARDQSLSAPLRDDGDAEWQDTLVADDPDQESIVVEASELQWRRDLLARGLETLNPRERHIIEARRLRDDSLTLADLAQVYGVSRERVRQIEVRAFEKLQKAMLTAASEEGLQSAAA